MACTIVIQDIRGVIPVGQTEVTVLRVVGDAPGCGTVEISSVGLGIAPIPVAVTGNQFFKDLPITVMPKPACGDTVDIRVECVDDNCEQHGNFQLPCCFLDVLSVGGITPGHALRPTTLEVAGTAAGCPIPSGATTASVHVSATTSAGAPIGVATAAVDNVTRRYVANVPVNQMATPVLCGETVTIVVSCDAGMTCSVTENVEVTCLDCYRVEAHVDLSAPCVGPAGAQTKKVTLTAEIGLRPGVFTQSFFWDLGGGITSPQFTATVASASGTYTHKETFDLPPGTYTAVLRFAAGAPENCVEYSIAFSVVCGGGQCPTIDPPTIGPCVNGMRTVTFVTHSLPAQQVIAQWDFTPTTHGSAFVLAPGAPANTQTFDYAPGTYTAVLRTLAPSGCADIPVQLTIPACPGTPPECDLDITGLPYTVGDCDANSKRLVTVTAQLNGTDPLDRYYWQWDPAIPATTGLPAPQGVTQSHLYDAPGTATTTRRVTLTVTRGPDCLDSTFVDVPIGGCGTDCPEIGGLQIDAANALCAPDGNHRTVVLDATVSGTGVSQYIWLFGDGTSATRPANVGPQVAHDYLPGTYDVTLRTTGPPNCSDEVTQRITVPPCCPNLTGIGVSQAPCQRGTPTVLVDLSASLTGEATSFVWDFGDGGASVTTTTPQAPQHSYAPGMYMVSVTASAANCPPSTLTQTITVDQCSDPTRTQIDICTGLLWTSIIMAIVGSITLLVGCVLAAIPYTAAAGEIVEWVGIGLVGTAALLFFFWWWFCRFITPCDVILTVRNVLLVMIVVFPVAALIVDLASGFAWPCFIKQLVTFAYWGTVLAMIDWLARNRRCLIENPSGSPPPPASSSSPLTGRDLTGERLAPGNEIDAARLGTSPRAQALPVREPAMAMPAEPARPGGLGDVVKTVTSAIGIKPCEGCHQRAERLNRAFPLRSSEQAAALPREEGGHA